jgi:hypothetical protein
MKATNRREALRFFDETQGRPFDETRGTLSSLRPEAQGSKAGQAPKCKDEGGGMKGEINEAGVRP